ncbi:MAG: hypothetical protein RBT71_05970, partial [Flavobacteriales bacterium]|nr:hypothetical protein [Flavobacteriales bacterium]
MGLSQPLKLNYEILEYEPFDKIVVQISLTNISKDTIYLNKCINSGTTVDGYVVIQPFFAGCVSSSEEIRYPAYKKSQLINTRLNDLNCYRSLAPNEVHFLQVDLSDFGGWDNPRNMDEVVVGVVLRIPYSEIRGLKREYKHMAWQVSMYSISKVHCSIRKGSVPDCCFAYFWDHNTLNIRMWYEGSGFARRGPQV